MHKWYEVKAKGNSTADVFIYGDIGESWNADESVIAKQYVKDISSITASDINVWMNSYGGSVADGLAIYNANKRHPANINVHIDGVAVSIASLIAMSGDTVSMAENSLLMIHAPWTGANCFAGNAIDFRKKADELNQQADVLDIHAKAMANSYMRGSITYDEALALLTDGQDHWYTAQEAKDAGFADVITEALPVAAHHDLSRFKSIPAAAGMFVKPQQPEIPMAKAVNKPLAADQETVSEEEENLEESQVEEPTEEAEEEVKPSAKAKPKVSAKVDEKVVSEKVLAAERNRREEIRARFKPFAHIQGVSDLADKCLDDHNVNVSAAVDRLMDVLGAGMEPTGGVHKVPNVSIVVDEKEKFVQAGAQALLARSGLDKHDHSNPFRAFSLFDFAKSSLEKAGVDLTGKDRFGIARMALLPQVFASGFGHGTSDFTVLLENVMHKTLLTAYATQPDTWSKFCAVGSVSDFRDYGRYRTGSISDIDDVDEHGEYKNKKIPDGLKEKVNVKRKGNIIQITPELVVNDDMNALTDLTRNLGRAAKRTIESRVYALLAANPTMNDGFALFSSQHGNLIATGTIPDVASFDLARVTMGSQRDIGSNEFLDVSPAIWIGSKAKGGSVRILNNAQYDPSKATRDTVPNIVNGMLSDIIDTPRITGNEWYLFANPAEVPVIEVTFLDGQQEPQLAQEDNFRTAGISYRVELPFGVSAVGYCGAIKNPGA